MDRVGITFEECRKCCSLTVHMCSKELIDLFMIKRETRHHKYSTFFLSLEEQIDNHLYLACCPLLFHRIVLYFDPDERCCPRFLFPFFSARSSSFNLLLLFVSNGERKNLEERKRKNLLSPPLRFLTLNDCLSLAFVFEQEEYSEWLCFKIISFSQSDNVASIFFVL